MGRVKRVIEKLKFATYCYKKGNDTRFVRNVKSLSEDNNLVYLESYGNEESDEKIYFIDMEESHSGFFAEHNRLLAMLYFADKYGLKPVVRYHQGYCYAENHPVNGTTNPFEYYYEQPGGISVEKIKSYKGVIRSKKENSYLVNRLCENANGYTRSEEYLDEMGRITAKYIKLNRIVKEKIAKDIQDILTKGQILGVHVRGTDFKQNFNGHPVKVEIEEYLEEAKKIFHKGNYSKVFLATDDSDAINMFSNYFKDKVVFYNDVIRSNANDTVMHSWIERENHHYLLGVEVLRDMYTLAACDGLVAGLSQVSYAARIQKKSQNEKYMDLVVLDRGINYHQKNDCPK